MNKRQIRVQIYLYKKWVKHEDTFHLINLVFYAYFGYCYVTIPVHTITARIANWFFILHNFHRENCCQLLISRIQIRTNFPVDIKIALLWMKPVA